MPRTRLCAAADIKEGEARGFYLTKGAFIVVKRNNSFYLYRNICPHLGTPLEWQENQFLDPDGELLQCASHGALFLIESGECLSGPCAGDRLISAAHEIENGDLYLL